MDHSILVPICITLAVLAGGGIGVKIFLDRRGNNSKLKLGKEPEVLMKGVNKRLAQNPRDPEALFTLADIYFNQENWDKAFRTYEILNNIEKDDPKIDWFQVHLRYGLSALKLDYTEAAYKGFSQAWTLKQDNFDVNYNMGAFEFQQKNYEKAVQFFSLARKQNPDHAPTLRGIGHAFFKLIKYREAMAFLRKAIELAPQDRESLFVLGECYNEVGRFDRALKIFSHLRADIKNGPQASLLAGLINMKQHQFEAAAEDFEFGLKHTNIEANTLRELRYHLSIAAIEMNDIGRAVTMLKVLQSEKPDYKDVTALIEKYEELNKNKNLQIFMLSSSMDFIALCRKVVLGYHAKSKTKIINAVMSRNDWADITAEVETPKWTDMVMFRFIRSQGSIGELIVRDLHSRLRETKSGRGICITIGVFSEEARRYTEARLIDLLEKEQLLALLSIIDAKIMPVQPDRFAEFSA